MSKTHPCYHWKSKQKDHTITTLLARTDELGSVIVCNLVMSVQRCIKMATLIVQSLYFLFIFTPFVHIRSDDVLDNTAYNPSSLHNFDFGEARAPRHVENIRNCDLWYYRPTRNQMQQLGPFDLLTPSRAADLLIHSLASGSVNIKRLTAMNDLESSRILSILIQGLCMLWLHCNVSRQGYSYSRVRTGIL